MEEIRRGRMERQSLLVVLLLSIACSIVFLPSKSDADWAYSFVIWDGFIYIVSDNMVNQVGQEIGKVTRYSDMEGTYTGNFSNTFAKGTKYYSILNISTEEAIAIKNSDGHYVKAIRDGKYSSNPLQGAPLESNKFGFKLLFGFLAILPIIAIGSYISTNLKK